MQVGLIGYGYWGKLLAKAIADDQRVGGLYIVSNQPDLNREIQPILDETGKTCQIVTAEKLRTLHLDGVIVAAPEDTHADLTLSLLEAGLACFIEKPLALTLSEASNIIATARRHNLTVHVDQVFSFDQQFAQLTRLVNQQLTNITDVMIYRSAPMTRQKNVSILADTFPHDLYQLRLGFGLELTSLDEVTIKSERILDAKGIASTATLAGKLARLHPIDENKPTAITYHGYHSWCGRSKQRLMVLGDRVTDRWVKWTVSDLEPATIQIWAGNKLVRQEPGHIQQVSPIAQMMSEWLTALEAPRSEYMTQMETHWSGILKDSYWLEQVLQLSIQNKHKRL